MIGRMHKIVEEEKTVYAALGDYPKAEKIVSSVSREIDWDIIGAFSFCLHLLEDVNAHKAFSEVEKLFEKYVKEMS